METVNLPRLLLAAKRFRKNNCELRDPACIGEAGDACRQLQERAGLHRPDVSPVRSRRGLFFQS